MHSKHRVHTRIWADAAQTGQSPTVEAINRHLPGGSRYATINPLIAELLVFQKVLQQIQKRCHLDVQHHKPERVNFNKSPKCRKIPLEWAMINSFTRSVVHVSTAITIVNTYNERGSHKEEPVFAFQPDRSMIKRTKTISNKPQQHTTHSKLAKRKRAQGRT